MVFLKYLRNFTYATVSVLGSASATPGQRHRGEDKAILAGRKTVYKAAKEKNPQRWSGDIRNWNPVTGVWLNPPKEVRAEEQSLPKAA